MSNNLWPHGLQYARLPCSSPTPRACSNSCPSSQWCNPTISSSAVPFSSCLQSFPVSESFLVSQFFASGGQSAGVSASTSVLPVNIQDRFPLGLTGWIYLQGKGLTKVFSNNTVQFSSVQFSHSVISDSVTPWTAACQASLFITSSGSLLKLMSIELVMPSNHLILCCPFLLLPLIFPSIRVFSNESVLRIRWPKYWSFSFSISPSNEYSELISFRMDCLDLLAVQGTLKSLLQHHSSKAPILQCSAFFKV